MLSGTTVTSTESTTSASISTTVTEAPPTCWTPWSPWTECPGGCTPTPQSRTRSRSCSDVRCNCTENTMQEEDCPSECPTTPICTAFKSKLVTNCSELCQTCHAYVNDAQCMVVECDLGRTCVCEPGYKMEDGRCKKKEDCLCYDDDGNERQPNVTYASPSGNTCEECMCNYKNKFVCYPKKNCCDWADWTPWSQCGRTCDSNITNTTRTRVSTSQNTCNYTSPQEETNKCPKIECDCIFENQTLSSGQIINRECYKIICADGNATRINRTAVDGAYSNWSDWSYGGCKKDCRDYSKVRTRDCEGTKCGGETCKNGQTEKDERPCSDAPCCEPQWSAWENCSLECHQSGEPRGVRNRTFVWNNQRDNGSCADPIQGHAESCGNLCECAIYQWTEWASCDGTCGIGEVTRTRNTDGNPLCSDMKKTETRPCFSKPCICDSEDERYGNYTTCEKSCTDKTEKPNCKEPPVSGCMCIEGTFRRADGKCVKEEECGKCIYRGKLYNDSDIIIDQQDNCTKYRCDKSELVTVNDCITECDLGTEDMVPAPPGSCCKYQCKKKGCIPHSEKVVIKVPDCIDSFKVDQYSCRGDCGISTVTFDVHTHAMVKECKCCAPVKTVTKKYDVSCAAGAEFAVRSVAVTQVLSCACDMCIDGT